MNIYFFYCNIPGDFLHSNLSVCFFGDILHYSSVVVEIVEIIYGDFSNGLHFIGI